MHVSAKGRVLGFVLGAVPLLISSRIPETELDVLVTEVEKDFLLAELERIHPPERIRELASYGERQSGWGGGFYGMMPDQLVDPDSIPVPLDREERLAAALCLARQRSVNEAALEEIHPDFPLEFRGAPLSEFLDDLRQEQIPESLSAVDLRLELDVTAVRGFFDALADGEVTMEEAEALASLPSNQAMLEHRRNLGYVPEPLPDTKSLARLIRMAGSRDPLDHLWCWVHPQNAFGYADLLQNEEAYHRLLSELDEHGEDLVRAVLARIARFTPAGTRFETTFALTVGWAIRGWATPEMAGLNIEQVKDDWDFLFGTFVEEIYHRLQLQLFPSPASAPAREFDDLLAIDTGDARLDRLHSIVAYTVAEGAANLVRGPFADPALEEKAPAGAELMARFVRQVVEQGDVEVADTLINEGLKSNGPLYGLGWHLATCIAKEEGERAVGDWQRRGPVAFFLRGAELAAEGGTALLDPEVVAAVRRLD
jgi:hypothetical protein